MNLLEFFLRRKGDCGLRRNRSLVCSPESNTGKLFKEEMNASTWSFFVKGSLFVASWRRLYDGFVTVSALPAAASTPASASPAAAGRAAGGAARSAPAPRPPPGVSVDNITVSQDAQRDKRHPAQGRCSEVKHIRLVDVYLASIAEEQNPSPDAARVPLRKSSVKLLTQAGTGSNANTSSCTTLRRRAKPRPETRWFFSG